MMVFWQFYSTIGMGSLKDKLPESLYFEKSLKKSKRKQVFLAFADILIMWC